MIFMIDNYDSFTYNIVQYLYMLGADVMVKRNDKTTIAEIEALNDQIFAKGTVVHPELFTEGLDLFRAEHTDLTVPVAAVGVLHDAPFRGQDSAGHLGFYGAPLGAGADCQKLTHSYLSSNAIHPAGSGHGTVVKMVFPGW